jgi:hypothetical protein
VGIGQRQLFPVVGFTQPYVINANRSRSKNLPAPLQDAWNRLAQVQPDASMAGADIEWLSASPDGDSYAIMTKGDKRKSTELPPLASV